MRVSSSRAEAGPSLLVLSALTEYYTHPSGPAGPTRPKGGQGGVRGWPSRAAAAAAGGGCTRRTFSETFRRAHGRRGCAFPQPCVKVPSAYPCTPLSFCSPSVQAQVRVKSGVTQVTPPLTHRHPPEADWARSSCSVYWEPTPFYLMIPELVRRHCDARRTRRDGYLAPPNP